MTRRFFRPLWNVLRSPLNFLATSVSRPFNQIANTASILGLLVSLGALFTWQATIIPIVYLCLLSLFLLIRYMRQERWARYSESAGILQRAYRHLQEASECSLHGIENPDLFIERLSLSLDSFAQSFTLITGSQCRACIAEVNVDTDIRPHRGSPPSPADIFVINIILRSGEQRWGPEKPQPVAKNTDFLHILQTGKPFFNNDLPMSFRKMEYENSKWDRNLLKTRDYPYRSTIVWPISQSAAQLAGPSELQPPLAFLCVDTKRVGAFKHVSDVPLGWCYAHAVYPVLRYLLPELDRQRE